MKSQDVFEKLMAELDEMIPEFNIPFHGVRVDDLKLQRFISVKRRAEEIVNDPTSFFEIERVDMPVSSRPHARIVLNAPTCFLITEDLNYELYKLFEMCDSVMVKSVGDNVQYLLGVEHIWRDR